MVEMKSVNRMKVSIITAVLNNRKFIESCINSVQSQTYPNIEHIIIDGGSTDGTLDIIQKYNNKIAKYITEKDNGIYDAMNKGIKTATGDIIGILNSDDMYYNRKVLETVIRTFAEENASSCYGDLVYVEKGNPEKVARYWKSGEFYKERFKKGWMPPHPTFFVRKVIYEKYGLLNLDFPLAADYEIMLRFLYRHEISTSYIPQVLVRMRVGGTSRPGVYTMKSVFENYRAWKVNGLSYPLTMLLKPFSKLFQYVPKKEV